MAPEQFIKYFEENDRPRLRLMWTEIKKMGISIGRVREDSVYDYKFVGLSHNTIRGAGGRYTLRGDSESKGI